MGLRFRRSIRILPGIRLNVGKRGVSTSIGVRGAHVTLRPGHTARSTVGIPGTGLSYTEGGRAAHKTAAEAPGEAQPAGNTEALPKGNARRGWLWIALIIVLISLGLKAMGAEVSTPMQTPPAPRLPEASFSSEP